MKDLTSLKHRRIIPSEKRFLSDSRLFAKQILISHLGENHAKNDQ